MIIYQIHEHLGRDTDLMDTIIYSYLNKEKAENKLKELEEAHNKRLEQADLCWDCDEDRQRMCKNYIPCGNYGMQCANDDYAYCTSGVWYEIKAAEVEE